MANPIPLETTNILLDSKYGQSTDRGVRFNISHHIEVGNKETATIFVSDFYTINGLYNFPEAEYKMKFVNGNVSQIITLPGGRNYDSWKDVAEGLTIGPENSVLPWDSTIAWDEGLWKWSIDLVDTGGITQFYIEDINGFGSLANRMGFKTGLKEVNTTHYSEKIVDINSSIHNLYVCISEITNHDRVIASGVNRSNVVTKIPIVVPFGQNIVFKAEVPVAEYPIKVKNLNQLTVHLVNDEDIAYLPNRFTMSLRVQKYYHNEQLVRDKLLEEIYQKMKSVEKYIHNPLATSKDVPVPQGLCELPNPNKDDVSIGIVREDKWWLGKNSNPYY